MKKHLRYLTFLPLLLIMILGTALTSSSQPTAQKGKLDPACESSCSIELRSCLFLAGRNSEENQCYARYQHCIAHCKP
jgi:hypothetical protein